jgi:hypothetical protein
MKGEEPDARHVDATLQTPDARIWDYMHGLFPSSSDYYAAAKAFHDERGYWPPGTPMARQEREKHDRYGPPGNHKTVSDYAGILTVAIRKETMAAGISRETLLWDSLRVEESVNHAARAVTDHIVYEVLREDMPPETVEQTRWLTHTMVAHSPATWRDHWKLTYGHRWWARWYVRRRPARTVERPHRQVFTATAEFDLERYRLYPRANASVVKHLGEPVTHLRIPQPLTFTWDPTP